MAIKGLFDPSAYVVGDYQTPLGYYSPARSVGDFVLTDYVEADYFPDTLTMSVVSSVQAEGTKQIIRATLPAQFTLSANGGYLLEGTASFTAFTTQVQLAGYLRQGRLEDPSWDDFAEDSFIDRTWDEWFGDAWDQGGVLFSVSTITKAVGGYRAFGTATVESAFTQQQNITIGIQKSITAQATQTANANFIATDGASPSGVFEQANVLFDRFRDITLNGLPQDVSSAFTQSANGNATFDISDNFVSAATVSGNGTAIFDLAYGEDLASAVTQSANGNAIFDLAYGEEFNVLGSQVAVGRNIILTDPYNIITVPQELRTLVVPQETLSLPVKQETRVNSITQETRSIDVKQETRTFKIFKPKFSDRRAIPRVRSDR